MCLIVLSWRSAGARLVLAANRDESHARPAAPLAWWTSPRILAGRDLEAGGTWLGLAPDGRFAALTNLRGGGRSGALSRGLIVPEFLAGELGAREYLAALATRAGRYSPFHLLVADGGELAYLASPGGTPRVLAPAIYALGNDGLDEHEEKLARTRVGLARLMAGAPSLGALIELLADREPAALAAGASEAERRLSAPFVLHKEYGTRCTTALVDAGTTIEVAEQSYDASGRVTGIRRESFPPERA
jgi:uncharacterized protein with NRDE domain